MTASGVRCVQCGRRTTNHAVCDPCFAAAERARPAGGPHSIEDGKPDTPPARRASDRNRRAGVDDPAADGAETLPPPRAGRAGGVAVAAQGGRLRGDRRRRSSTPRRFGFEADPNRHAGGSLAPIARTTDPRETGAELPDPQGINSPELAPAHQCNPLRRHCLGSRGDPHFAAPDPHPGNPKPLRPPMLAFSTV